MPQPNRDPVVGRDRRGKPVHLSDVQEGGFVNPRSSAQGRQDVEQARRRKGGVKVRVELPQGGR